MSQMKVADVAVQPTPDECCPDRPDRTVTCSKILHTPFATTTPDVTDIGLNEC